MASDWIELAGKSALVTGAAKRLGRAAALALAAQGVHIALHYRYSEREAEDTAEAVRAQGVQAWTFQADLAEPDAAAALFEAAHAAIGPVDFVINSASIYPEQTLEDMTAEALCRNMRINAFAPLVLGRALAAQGHPGVIVNYLDTMVADYDRKHVPYNVSKRALDALTRMMAVSFAPMVRVNAVAPGLVLPPVGKDESYLAALAHSNPLNRYGSETGVCEAVLFLLRSAFVTGQTIFVDGGRHLRGSMYG